MQKYAPKIGTRGVRGRFREPDSRTKRRILGQKAYGRGVRACPYSPLCLPQKQSDPQATKRTMAVFQLFVTARVFLEILYWWSQSSLRPPRSSENHRGKLGRPRRWSGGRSATEIVVKSVCPDEICMFASASDFVCSSTCGITICEVMSRNGLLICVLSSMQARKSAGAANGL